MATTGKRGGKRQGAGRRKGIPNRRSQEARDKALAEGKTPIEYMLGVMNNGAADADRRDRMAAAAAPYCHPRLAAVEHTGANGGPIQTLDLSNLNDEQLKQIEPLLRTLAAAGGAAGAGEGGDPPTRARGRKT